MHSLCFTVHQYLAAALALFSIVVSSAQSPEQFQILVFSKTTAFRHDSIPDGLAAIRSFGASNSFSITATEDAAQFNNTNLSQYAAVIFLCTSGEILDATQQAAFERYIGNGGAYVGIHSASDTEHDWPWYGELVGAFFSDHPAIQPATIKVLDRVHPSTQELPEKWVRTDEWYNFNKNPRGKVHVLATLDEKTYSGGSMGFDHPIAWSHEYSGGRSWYTAGGHTRESYADPLFRQHLLGGILWAAGRKTADPGPTIDVNFRKTVLDPAVSEAIKLAVAPDGRVFFVEKTSGALKIYHPEDHTTVMAGQVPVYAGNEDGLLGIALAPSFTTNNWIYLFYSAAGDVAEQHVARFTLTGNSLDLNTREILLRIPTQRDECCHSGGSLEFGPQGDLYIATGDNTNPFASNGYAPIDERPGRSPWDAQKSSSNMNDLRGKILRIRPTSDGRYTIPDGNLFPKDGSAGRPEIYVMGCRNPFRISIDSSTGWLYWGEVGPDAWVADPLRGPEGYDEFNQARSAGNYGWPYFVANNKAYVDYDFALEISGLPFNPDAPINDSPNNTGQRNLPPARPAWIWYPYFQSTVFPEIQAGWGRTAMAGPVYHYDPALSSNGKLPAYYDKTLFIYDWTLNWMREVKFDSNGDILSINPFLASLSFVHLTDMEIGPDGTIYALEWGNRFDKGNIDGRLVRIQFSPARFVLQSSDAINGEFLDEEANFDGDSKSFTIDRPSGARFYRVRGATSARIGSALVEGPKITVKTE